MKKKNCKSDSIKEHKTPFFLIPNCSIVAWRLTKCSDSGSTDTEDRYYGQIVNDMLDYFEKIGASIEEIKKSKIICLDSSGGGALSTIAWAFKISKDVLNEDLERSHLSSEAFEDEFESVLQKIWDTHDYDALIKEQCRIVGEAMFDDKDI